MSHVGLHVVGRRLEDRFVVVNLRTNRIYELNRTASALWELLEAGADVSELEAKMSERFDVTPDELRHEVDQVMRRMRDAGLVTA
jgi:predicted transcriptional regulator